MSPKFPIGSLPLPASSYILTHNLTPDPVQPSVQAFYENLKTKPSVQRRSRQLHPSSHFSYVAPLPLPFPYRVVPPEGDEEEIDKTEVIENWLSKHEPLCQVARANEGSTDSELRKYTAIGGLRDQPRHLLAISAAGLRDCLPHLDVGDAFDFVGPGSLTQPTSTSKSEENAARQELVDVLSGHSVLMHIPEGAEEKGYAPWSLRYSGHQFGSWAGQLGDGRAISLLATPHPDDPTTTYEIQIKGGGRTPFSRGADGLAVMRSSVREFLGAEAIHALRIPTTRSLSLIDLPELPVVRERLERASIATRIAPSFLRIGNFETFNPPHELFFLFSGGSGGGAKDWEGIRILGEWVVEKVLKLDKTIGAANQADQQVGGKEKAPWGKRLVMEVARRNAEMLSGWQAYGFMHGVMNTDNISLLGLTIDYGPYAFMDAYDYDHICNHSDDGGRYSFKVSSIYGDVVTARPDMYPMVQMQPTMIIFALRSLLNALAPLIGAESELGHRVEPGWAQAADTEQISAWAKKADEIREEVDDLIKTTFEKKYWKLMRDRLGLRKENPGDVQTVIQPLLDVMQTHGLDFHGTFRALCAFRPAHMDDPVRDDKETGKGKAPSADAYAKALKDVEEVIPSQAPVTCALPSESAPSAAAGVSAPVPALEAIPEPTAEHTPLTSLLARLTPPELVSPESREKACRDIIAWLEKYAVRILEDQDESWTEVDLADRERRMRAVNPRFVLRQWVLEEVIAGLDEDVEKGRSVLVKVLDMASRPFEPWGAEDDSRPESELGKEERAERRLCGVGSVKFLGFQCSCSS
ncbi:hypothetical protein FRC06_008060 [Ceratobasidium sp. 370]|nr:hypothetical protein FRC06_008060 [Ceratobasidium sp. 370]